jgi:hypothetical protein
MEVVRGVIEDIDDIFGGAYVHFGGDEINENCWD